MRVEDPVNKRGGLKLGSALILNQNLYFEMASETVEKPSINDFAIHKYLKSL